MSAGTENGWCCKSYARPRWSVNSTERNSRRRCCFLYCRFYLTRFARRSSAWLAVSRVDVRECPNSASLFAGFDATKYHRRFQNDSETCAAESAVDVRRRSLMMTKVSTNPKIQKYYCIKYSGRVWWKWKCWHKNYRTDQS